MTVVGTATVEIIPAVVPDFQGRIAGQLSGGLGGGTGLAGQLTAAGSEAETAAAGIEKESVAAEKAVTSTAKLSPVSQLLTTQLNSLGGASNGLSGALGQLDKAGFGASSTLAGLGGPVAVAVAAIGASVFVQEKAAQSYADWATQIKTVQNLIGGSAKQASDLTFAFQEFGVQTDVGSRALVQASKRLQDGTLDLSKYGVEVARTRDGQVDMYATIASVADAMHRLGAGTESTTLATEVFGTRTAQKLIPILLQGSQAMKDLQDQAARSGLEITSQDQLDKGRAFSLELKQLDLDLKGLEVTLGRDVLPVVDAFVKTLDEVVVHGRPALDFVVRWYERLNPIAELGKFFGGSSKAIKDLSAASQSATDDLSGLADVGKVLASQMDAISAGAAKLIDSEKAAADASDSMVASAGKLTDAQDALNKLAAVGGADMAAYATAVKAARDATVALETANNDVAKANLDVKDKQLAYNDAVYKYGINSLEAQKAAQGLTDAHVSQDVAANRVQDSTDQLGKALKDQSDAAAGSEASAKRLRDAQDAVASASKAYQDAVYSSAKATAQLADDQATANGQTETAIDKNQNLISAFQNVANSLDANNPLRKNLQGYIEQLITAGGLIAGVGGASGVSTPDGITRLPAAGGAGQKGSTGIVVNIYQAPGQSAAATAQAVDATLGGAPAPADPLYGGLQ